jgi:predicted lysophospholipase L1 biosynthesis ABC-type transport system permease subunit
VVNETLARTFWPGESPLGKRIMATGDSTTWLTIVGVVEDVRYAELRREPRPAWYVPAAQAQRSLGGSPARGITFVVRAARDPLALAAAVRRVMREVDAKLPIVRLEPLESVVAQSMARPRFTMTLLGLFAAVALALGCIGLYGVLAYAVTQRTRELGIRMALGAPNASLAGSVLRQGMLFALVGLAAGALAALGVTRLLEGMLFGVTATDPATFGAMAAFMVGVALLACLIPTLRALRVDPVVALRAE